MSFAINVHRVIVTKRSTINLYLHCIITPNNNTMQITGFTDEELQIFADNVADKAILKYIEAVKPRKQPASLIDTEECGIKWGKHPITIRRWIHKGLLNGYKVGGRLMIDLEEANAMIREKKVVVRQFPEA